MFQDLALKPEAVVGDAVAARPLQNVQIVVDQTKSTKSVAQIVKAFLDLKGTADGLIGSLLIRTSDPTPYTLDSYLSRGSFGKVYKFTNGGPTNLALKVLLQKPQLTVGNKGLPTHLTCNVIKTAHFHDGHIQVMEMGNTETENVPFTPANQKAFVEFSNDTARCLFGKGLVCTDWKLDNTTAFVSGSAVQFRVIDVDGIAFPARAGVGYPYTYSGLTVPPMPMPDPDTADDPEKLDSYLRLAILCAARALIQTAYSIELAKVMFDPAIRNNFVFRSLMRRTGARNSELADATISDTYDQLVGLVSVAPKIPSLIQLCKRLRSLDRFAKTLDEQKQLYAQAKRACLDWFASKSAPAARTATPTTPEPVIDSSTGFKFDTAPLPSTVVLY